MRKDVDSHKEFENLQMELETIATERDELLAAKATMDHKIESLEIKVEDITDAREAETRKL